MTAYSPHTNGSCPQPQPAPPKVEGSEHEREFRRRLSLHSIEMASRNLDGSGSRRNLAPLGNTQDQRQ